VGRWDSLLASAGRGTRSYSTPGRRAGGNPLIGGFSSGGPRIFGSAVDENADVGKGPLDMTDPIGSAIGVVGSFGAGVGGLLGGFGEVTGLKNIAVPVADFVTKNPVSSAIGGAVGGLAGGAMEAITGLGQSVEEVEARARLRGASGAPYGGNSFFTQLGDMLSGREGEGVLANIGLAPSARATAEQRRGLPPDILTRLDNGENVDRLAEELTNRGEGFSSNVTVELAKGILTDPLNILGPLGGMLFGGARAAGRAVGAAERGGRAVAGWEEVTGRTYNTVAGGLNGARQKVVQATIGPFTSGVLHAAGIRNYTTLTGGLRALNPEFAKSLDDALAVGNAQLFRAWAGHEAGSFWRSVFHGQGRDIRAALPDVEDEIVATLEAQKKIGRGSLEKRVQELFTRVGDISLGATGAERAERAALRASQIIDGLSVEEARRLLGSQISDGTAMLIDLAYYGRAVDDFVTARAASTGAKNIDVGRLTIISPNTLTKPVAIALRQAIADGDDISAAVTQYDALTQRFLGKDIPDSKIDEYLKNLIDGDALPDMLIPPTARRNPLPKPLGDWQAKYAREGGYQLGFAPKDGWKAIITQDGDVIVTDPFVFLQGTREALSLRNPIGRFADSLMRGVSQEVILAEAANRAVAISQAKGAGLSPAQMRTVMRAVAKRAADAGETPRGLAAMKNRTFHVVDESGATVALREGNGIDEAFDSILTPEEMTSLRQKIDPTVLLMMAMEGNLNRVGLTQKITGRAKTLGAQSKAPVAEITDHLYPGIRFTANVFFRIQDSLEAPFFKMLRGIKEEIIDPEVQRVYDNMAAETDFRSLAEMEYVHRLGNHEATRRLAGPVSRIGKAIGSYEIAARKNTAMIAQRMAEHGDEFERVVNELNPRLWQTMTEAYGTTNANEVARSFMLERSRLANGQVDEAMRAAGVSDVSRATGLSADEATLMTAWRESFRRASKQAFTTQYFNPERGWLERTLNHPYLGLYPLSYMWGKVLPEFARFLLVRPFGLRAPLVGYAAMQRAQQAMLAWAQDPEFSEFLKQHKDTIYAVELLLPGQPTNLPVHMPAWARHVSRDARNGKDINLKTVEREAKDTMGTLAGKLIQGPLAGVGVLKDLIGDLERAGKAFDTWGNPPEREPILPDLEKR